MTSSKLETTSSKLKMTSSKLKMTSSKQKIPSSFNTRHVLLNAKSTIMKDIKRRVKKGVMAILHEYRNGDCYASMKKMKMDEKYSFSLKEIKNLMSNGDFGETKMKDFFTNEEDSSQEPSNEDTSQLPIEEIIK